MRSFPLFLTIIGFVACNNTQQIENYKAAVNPFKLYSPSFNTSIEHNEIFQEWNIRNSMMGIHKKGFLEHGKKDSIYYVISGSERFPVAINFHADYEIPIPEKAKRLKLNIFYEYQKYKDSELNLQILFQNRTTILRKTKIILAPTISELTEKLPYSNKEIKLEIPPLANYCKINLLTASGIVLLGQCKIKIDGKRIDKLIYDHSLPFTSSEIFSLKNNLSDTLNIYRDTKILGIGESVHGSKELLQQGITIIKEMISKGYCNILFLEASPIIGYNINQYVDGKTKDLHLLTKMEKNGYNNSLFLNLIEFIKTYNSINTQKVLVVGIDISDTLKLDSLFISVSSMISKSPEIKKCTQYLLNLSQNKNVQITNRITKNDFEEIKPHLIKAINRTENRLSYYENFIYRHLLDRTSSYINLNENTNYSNARDSLMAINIFRLLDKFPVNSKSIIYSHLGHVANINYLRETKGHKTPSMGYYLSQKYDVSYRIIGLFAGSGEIWTGRYVGYDTNLSKGIFKLSPPIGRSIEQLCFSLNESSFYINNVVNLSVLDKVVYSRFIGKNWMPMQFEPIDLRRSLNTIWFVRESNAY